MARALYETFNRTGKITDQGGPAEELEKLLKSSDDGIIQAFELRKEDHRNNNIIIIIDQFEELFRYKQSPTSFHNITEVSHFIQLILTALNRDVIPLYIIISMRSDFIDECTEYPGLTEKINQGHYLVPRMTKEEIRSAITGPVRVSGGAISDKLVSRLLKEAGSDPDQLPVLQHALMRTWANWQQDPSGDAEMDEHHYEAIGTMSEALSIHAEEIYNELPDQRHQYIAEKLFKALTAYGEDNKGTRRPTQLSEINSIASAKVDEVITVINSFRSPGRTFLMPPYETPLDEDAIIDITHESIMRIWHRVHQWVEEETRSAQLYLRLSKSAELYQEGKTGLWVDPELHLALNWMENDNPNQSWANRYDPAFDRAMAFLKYSKKEADLEVAKREERQHRELIRTRRFAIILGVASIISIFFLVIALNLMFKAEASEKKALEKEKLAQVESRKAAEERQESIIQNKISEQQRQIAEQQKVITEEQKQYAISQQNIAIQERKEAVHQRQVAEVAKVEAVASRDEAEKQSRVAVEQKQIADAQKVKAETSEQDARRLRLLAVAKAMAVKADELKNTVKSDLPALLALQAYQWNIANGGKENDPDIFRALASVVDTTVIMRGHKDEVKAIVTESDGHSLVSCSLDGTVKLWDLNDPSQPPHNLNTGKWGANGFYSLALNHNGHLLAAGTHDGAILLWDMLKPQAEPLILQGHTAIVTHLSFNADDALASSSADGSVRVWHREQESSQPDIITQSDTRINAVCFSPDGSSVVWGTAKGEVKLYNLKSMMAAPILLQPAGNAVYSLTFSKNGHILAIGDENGLIRLHGWENPTQQSGELIGHLSRITALLFSPDGHTLASCSFDGTIRLWDYENPEEQPMIIDDHDFWITGIAFTPDGNRLASCSADKTIRERIINAAILAARICPVVSRNMTQEEWNKYVGNDIGYVKTCPSLP
jgi:WD40 repeat protein